MALYRLLSWSGLLGPALVVESVDTGTEKLTLTAHGLRDRMAVRMASDGTLPSPLDADTRYFVRAAEADALELSASAGGSAVNLTTTGSGNITVAPEAGMIVLKTTGALIPQDLGNREFLAYLDWLALPSSVDPIAVETVAAARLRCKRDVRLESARRADLLDPSLPEAAIWWAERLAQAILCDADGTPTTGEYPLLDAEVGITDTTLALVADAVLAQWATIEAGFAALAAVELQAFADMDDAADVAAVEVVLAAITWP